MQIVKVPSQNPKVQELGIKAAKKYTELGEIEFNLAVFNGRKQEVLQEINTLNLEAKAIIEADEKAKPVEGEVM